MGAKRQLPRGMTQRGRMYWADFTYKRKRYRESLGDNFTLACDLLAVMRARLVMGEHGVLDNHESWDRVFAEYMRWADQHLAAPEMNRAALDEFFAWRPLGSVSEITPARMLEYREHLLTVSRVVQTKRGPKARRANSPRTVNRKIGVVRSMLNKAVEWKLIRSNPIAGFKDLRGYKEVKVRRAMSKEEVAAFLEASTPSWRPLWRFIVGTVCRYDEACQITWDRIDLTRGTATVLPWETKSKGKRIVPLDSSLWDWLREHRRTQSPASDYVFATMLGTPRGNNGLRSFYAACRRAKIEGGHSRGSVDIHSLRATFATLSLDSGASPRDVQAILGHSTLKLTMDVYAKTRQDSQRSAIDAIGLPQIHHSSASES